MIAQDLQHRSSARIGQSVQHRVHTLNVTASVRNRKGTYRADLGAQVVFKREWRFKIAWMGNHPEARLDDVAKQRYSYGAWHGGPDPLEPPYDIREALDDLGEDVLRGMSPREALNRLLRRGQGDRNGLD